MTILHFINFISTSSAFKIALFYVPVFNTIMLAITLMVWNWPKASFGPFRQFLNTLPPLVEASPLRLVVGRRAPVSAGVVAAVFLMQWLPFVGVLCGILYFSALLELTGSVITLGWSAARLKLLASLPAPVSRVVGRHCF